MKINYDEFQEIYKQIQSYGKITIRFTKEKDNQIIHKDIKLYHKNNTFYLKEVEYNQSTNTKTELQAKQEITEASFDNEHAYLATLFSTLKKEPSPKVSTWQDFKNSSSKLKWLTRYFLLDTRLIGGVVGQIIAYAANSENKHYKTIPSHILAKTLGPLIFPAGSKEPMVDSINQPGLITIDSILHKQYKALRNYDPVYISPKEPNSAHIRFEPKPVSMLIDNMEVQLETVIASNNLVNTDNKNDQLHVIYFNGNSGCFQQDYKLVAEDLLSYGKNGVPVTAVQFNYPGVLNSEGSAKVAQDLINAGIAQVQALLDEGVPHSKIVLHGVSLGGSIASHVAAHFNQLKKLDDPEQNQTLAGLYVSRTFASTAQVGRDFFNRALGDNIISRIISTLCLPFIKIGTWGSEWDLDTGKAFFSLPRDKRNYAVIISPEANREEYRKAHKGSFFTEVVNFFLRREKNPVDDAILRRGLHDSWERRFEGFLTKRGFYGEEARKNYSSENSYRKMMVVDLKKKEFAPDIDGHAKANYCYKKGGEYLDPKKEKKSIGMVHRAPATTIFKDEKERRALPLKGNEAGEVARRSILAMVGN